MALNPPTPGLRPLYLDAVSNAKVSLSVPPGTVIVATDDVAAALVAADPHFHDLPADAELERGRAVLGKPKKPAVEPESSAADELASEVLEAPKKSRKG